MNSMTLTHSAVAVEDDSKGWKLVPPAEVPAVTYQAYVSVAAIEPSTREALRSCSEYPLAAYSPPNFRTLHTYTSSNLALYRRVSTRYGLVDHCVRASRNIAAGTAVCMLGGRLTESWKVDAQVQLEHGFALKRDELRTYFDFSGEASLVVLTDQHSNIAKYIRDPLHRHTAEQHDRSNGSGQEAEEEEVAEERSGEDETEGMDSNVRPDTYFDRQSRLFFVLIYATEAIAKGDELFSHRFLGDWRTKAHHEMFLAARVSHWLHRYVLALEKQLLSVLGEEEVPPPPAPISVSALTYWHEAERMVHSAMSGVHDRKLLMEVQTMQTQPQTLAPISLADALQLTGCEFTQQTILGRSVSSTTRRKLRALPSVVMQHLLIDGKEHPVSEDEVLQLIERGHNDELIEVREVLSVTSPARFFSPPSLRAFCVTAKHTILAGQLIAVYAGELEERVQYHGSSYVYNLPRREGQQQFGRQYDLPDLILDAHGKGGISRFINDSAWRGGQRDDQRAVNTAVCWAYVKRPVLIVYALKPIAQGDECITSYGDEFWSIMCKQSMQAQRRYQCAVRPYILELEQLCADKGLPLPGKPNYDIEQEPLFQTKPLPYTRPRTKGKEEDDEDNGESPEKNGASVGVKVEPGVEEERKESTDTTGSTHQRTRTTRSSASIESVDGQRDSATSPTEQLGRGRRSKRSRPEPAVQQRKQQPTSQPRRTSQRAHSAAGKDEWLGDKPAFVTVEEEEAEYSVERIVKQAYDKTGRLWYCVKWLGWPEADNSWVREADMAADELLAAFKEEQATRMEEIVRRIKETKEQNRQQREREWAAKEEERRRQQEEQLKQRQDSGALHNGGEADSRRRSMRPTKPPADPHHERGVALLLERRPTQRSSKPRPRAKPTTGGEMHQSAGPASEDRSLADMLAERGYILSRPSPTALHDGAEDAADEQDEVAESDVEMEEESGSELSQSEVVQARVIASVGSGGSILFNQSVPSFASSVATVVLPSRSSAEVALSAQSQEAVVQAASVAVTNSTIAIAPGFEAAAAVS